MEMSRYSIKSSAGKGLIGFVTTLNIAGEFDPAWLDSNPQIVHHSDGYDYELGEAFASA